MTPEHPTEFPSTTESPSVEIDDEFGHTLYQTSPTLWLGTLIGPFILTALILALICITPNLGMMYARNLVAAAMFTFFVAGRFMILGGGHEGFFSSWELALLVFYMDAVAACLLVFHTGFLFRLPYVGKKFQELVKDGKFILAKNPWMKRATFFGIVAFVAFPLAATGSIGGTVFGRLLGLSRWLTFAGLILGSMIGCCMMVFGAELITTYFNRDDPRTTIIGIVVVLVLIGLLNWRYKSMKNAHYLTEVAESSDMDAPTEITDSTMITPSAPNTSKSSSPDKVISE